MSKGHGLLPLLSLSEVTWIYLCFFTIKESSEKGKETPNSITTQAFKGQKHIRAFQRAKALLLGLRRRQIW